MSSNNTKIIGALLLGAAVGVAIGILLVPEKGSDTREKIKDSATDLANNAEEEIKDVIDALKKKVNEMEDTLIEGLETAKKMVEEKANQIKSKVA